ncbi:unnamed protein product [Didymodactylos carnosus]|uniref:Uncharacterized protein n=1 Tax=Didymodactylos carnosus TaxID=1234261 RepID=A0A813VBK3_9BILA|nr:unnamed protein product [Didymodactylos carnosus]CAF3625135.1 unnamed protein product [Didymodactylos carnosus]
MGTCTSSSKKHSKKHSTTKDLQPEQQQKKSLNDEHGKSLLNNISNHGDQFTSLPYIDEQTPTIKESKDKPKFNEPPTKTTDTTNNSTDDDERTTVRTNFETNVSYSSAETIENLKQEVYKYVQEKILPSDIDTAQLYDYIIKRFPSNINQDELHHQIERCLDLISKNQTQDLLKQLVILDSNENTYKKILNTLTTYVSSLCSDNSFLKALYGKFGDTLDIDMLNAETNEHEVVNVTVTKTIKQVYINSPTPLSNLPLNNSSKSTTTTINEQKIPDDLPDDIRRKAEQVMNSVNDAFCYAQYQGQDLAFENQASLEDRFYNNKSFQVFYIEIKEEYPVNDPEVGNAALKIQAQFRGHKARKEIEKMKKTTQNDFDQQELGYQKTTDDDNQIDRERQQQQQQQQQDNQQNNNNEEQEREQEREQDLDNKQNEEELNFLEDDDNDQEYQQRAAATIQNDDEERQYGDEFGDQQQREDEEYQREEENEQDDEDSRENNEGILL